MICENPLNFENNIQSKRHFCGANYFVQWAQKINSHACFSNIIIETKKKYFILQNLTYILDYND